ncbi:MAG: CHRD domain-containing protein [Candidatus Sumerlaeaceae bacterium]
MKRYLLIAATLLTAVAAPAQVREMVAFLNGVQETPATTSTAVGTARFTVDVPGSKLYYFLDFAGLSTTETAAHIHGPADPGTSASAVFGLALGTPKSGNVTLTPTQLSDILAGRYYVNVHSTLVPAGEIRGQIVTHVAAIDGAQEPSASTATGYGLMTLDRTTNVLSYFISSTIPLVSQSAAHFHGDALHSQSASPIVTLPLTEPKVSSATLTALQVTSLDAGKWYINIHTGTFPGGEIRGQVVRRLTTLNGQQEPTASTARGYGMFSQDTAGNLLGYYMTYAGLSSAETAAHFHSPGARGATASPVFTLPAGSPKLGLWSHTATDATNLANGNVYVNVHTSLFTGGEIRGQLDAPIAVPASIGDWDLY